MDIGHKFTVIEKQYYGRGKTRVVKLVSVEYEVISEVLKSKIDTKFVWVKTLNGKNTGKEIPWTVN
jgi:hypothetical protein